MTVKEIHRAPGPQLRWERGVFFLTSTPDGLFAVEAGNMADSFASDAIGIGK
jgi:hypothetical protein